ncbi:SusF/SusE family outer membrane protein [Labilibacter sediminis]|nr:SusF/SusE family outer membrane protein [Labilibacter sediminis]
MYLIKFIDMHKIIIYGFLMLIALSACDDVNKLQLGEITNPVLSSEVANKTIVLTDETSDEAFDSFEWTIADFGFPSADPEYTLQMDFEGNDFQSAIALVTTFDLKLDTINALINQKLITLGAEPGVATKLEFKVTGSVHNDVIAESNVLSATITPYEIILVYPKIYVTGDQNGWSFIEDDLLYSVSDNEIFEGYIYMGADNYFKMSYQPNWDSADAIIGDPDASGTTGNLQVGNWGGNNIFAPDGAGVYFIKANIPNFTYSIYKTEWAITGDFTSWGFAPMTYDEASDTWSLTADVTAGGFKFIANEDWSKVKGDNEMDGILDKGTDENNIVIAEDGNYTITMDLSQALYTYSVVKNN